MYVVSIILLYHMYGGWFVGGRLGHGCWYLWFVLSGYIPSSALNTVSFVVLEHPSIILASRGEGAAPPASTPSCYFV